MFQRFPSKIIKIVDKFGLNVQIFDVIGYSNLWGVCLFQGVRLLIFKIFPGGTFIPESRVCVWMNIGLEIEILKSKVYLGLISVHFVCTDIEFCVIRSC